jgi:hypothetical protein
MLWLRRTGLLISTYTLLLGCSTSTPPVGGPTGGSPGAGGASGPGVGGAGPSSGGTGDGGALGPNGGSSASSGGVGSPSGGQAGAVGGTNAAGGMPESGGNGAGFFGDSRCESSGLRLCDGFESGNIDTALWQVQSSAGNVVEITSEQAARGTNSIHIRTNNGYGYLQNRSFFPAPQNSYFGRMFLRVKRFSTVEWAHWTIGEAAGTGDGSVIRVGGQYRTDLGKNRWGVGSDGGPTGDWTTHDTDPAGQPEEPPTDAWVCLEWEHRGEGNVTRFFVDGEEHPSLATSTTEHGGTASADYVLPEVESFWFGFWQYQADPEPFDVWIDELSLHDERIGCEK